MADVGGHEYIIYAQRISDQTVHICTHRNPIWKVVANFRHSFRVFQVILSCVINRDLQYYKVMPTFHHWRAGKQRNGLTFQTAADARAFDKGIVKAYDDLIDGKQSLDGYLKNNLAVLRNFICFCFSVIHVDSIVFLFVFRFRSKLFKRKKRSFRHFLFSCLSCRTHSYFLPIIQIILICLNIVFQLPVGVFL